MTNSYDVDHGLSQVHPGPEEPVEIAPQPGAAPATGNTARDQEMYAAGIRTGEENAKHNAAIRGAWLPIESAPQTGRTLLLGYWNSLGKWRTVRGQWMSLDYIAENWEEPDDAEAGWFETAVEAEEVPNCWRITPSHWQPIPTAPGTPASPVSTVQDERQAFEAWFTRHDETKDIAERAVRRSPSGTYVLMQTYTAWEIWQAARASVSAPAAGDAPKPDFPRVGQIVDEYVQEYELRGEDEEGRDGVYSPTETERYMIADAIYGLLAEPEFIAAIAAQRKGDAA